MFSRWSWSAASTIALLALCAGCGSESGTSPVPASTTSLAGTDANNDGIRDDIEVYIDSTVYDVATKKALRQYAKAAQSSILEADDPAKSLDNVTKRFRALECLMARRPTDFHPVFVELRARLLDTNPRSEAYMNADSQAAASNIPLLPADQWEGVACL